MTLNNKRNIKITEYSEKYSEEVKKLLIELQEHIADLDKEKYNILTDQFGEQYFEKTIKEVQEHNGKILLAQEDDKITGLIAGIINNEAEESFCFRAPKRGKITEFIVSEKFRSHGTGKLLLEKMEDFFKKSGCRDVLLEVFGSNKEARKFYCSKGYGERTVEMMKKL